MVLQDYHEELEADLLDKGIDLLDFYRGKLSFRRLGVVIRTFGPGTALWRVLVDQWGPVEHLLADQIDILLLANWQRGGDGKARKPDPYPRPGSKVIQEEKRDYNRERAEALRARTQQRKGG